MSPVAQLARYVQIPYALPKAETLMVKPARLTVMLSALHVIRRVSYITLIRNDKILTPNTVGGSSPPGGVSFCTLFVGLFIS
jgi:hypothetical protein